MTGYMTKITLEGDDIPHDATVRTHTKVFIEKEQFTKFISCMYTYNLISIEAQKLDVEPETLKVPIVNESTFGYFAKVVPKEYSEPRFISEKEYDTVVKSLETDNDVEKMSISLVNIIYTKMLDNLQEKEEEAAILEGVEL